ncbi:hypothetical protein N1078_18395 [Pseudomonas sp. MIL19]|uniref:hypothetical protein n=1 Tax=Pseudomonas sp. MIL19 TaxID=2976979 RepID=UPI00236418E1|nr:hypothetical protein [Pseudomonas sp. MIL19]MDD2162533.1 hypothetical protein [Pseudomonas sp. MIL19]
MQDCRGRPLTRHENNIRLLFQHADEIINKLEFLNSSADRLERIEVMINGLDGVPGLIELIEAMSFEINRLERWGWRASNVNINEVSNRLSKIESILNRYASHVEIIQKDKKRSLHDWGVTACIFGGVALGVLNLSLLAWSAIA